MCPLLTAKWAIALLLCNKCHHYKNLSEIQCVICFDSCTQLKIFLAYLKKNSLSKIHLGIISHVFFMRFSSYLRTFQKPKPGTIGTQEGKEGEHLLQLVLVTRTFCGSAELHLVFFLKVFFWVSTFCQGHVRFSVQKNTHFLKVTWWVCLVKRISNWTWSKLGNVFSIRYEILGGNFQGVLISWLSRNILQENPCRQPCEGRSGC